MPAASESFEARRTLRSSPSSGVRASEAQPAAGKVHLLDPTTRTSEVVGGFAESTELRGGHTQGPTVPIDVATHTVHGAFTNGCDGSRLLSIDEPRSLLFTACVEGRVTAMDLAHGGRIVGRLAYGQGMDAIAYDARRGLLHVPSAATGTVATISVGALGELALASRRGPRREPRASPSTTTAASGSAIPPTDGSSRSSRAPVKRRGDLHRGDRECAGPGAAELRPLIGARPGA